MSSPAAPSVLVLGASSGFGEATALEFAAAGFDVFGVHLDRKQTLPHVEEIVAAIEARGRKAHFFNVNAADHDNRAAVIAAMKSLVPPGGVRAVLHSLAFGTLKPFIAEDEKEAMTPAQLDMTLDVMAHSLVYWAQDLVRAGLLGHGGRIYAMTSAGDHIVWKAYGAVSAAKVALEAHIRQLAVELAPLGITANAIKAGVTDTPALRKIPGNEALIEGARGRNPAGRLTTPEDVARCIVALAVPGTQWLTGTVLHVDGGEDIAG